MTKKKSKPSAVPAAAKNANAVEQADVAVAKAVAPYEDAFLVQVLGTFGKIGDQPPMLAISGAVLAAGLVRADRRMAKAGFRMIAAHLLATGAKNFIKHRVDRTRPGVLVAEGRYKMKPGRNRSKEETSFPSGHTAGAVAVGRAFAREYPEHAGPAYGAAGTIALAQIPRCAHYPTDIAAGAAIGLIAESLTSFAFDRLVPEPD